VPDTSGAYFLCTGLHVFSSSGLGKSNRLIHTAILCDDDGFHNENTDVTIAVRVEQPWPELCLAEGGVAKSEDRLMSPS
jgi:hypothetical protein